MYCCEQLDYFVNQKCVEHKSVFECPDIIILYENKFDEYGIIIHDSGESYIKIQHCPWCGRKLPESKRDLWFDELEKRGIEDPMEQDIPKEFESDEWWKRTER